MDGGRTRVPGPGPGSDDPLAVERGPYSFVADVALDHVRDGRVEEDVHRLLVACQQLLQLRPVRRRAQPGVALGTAQRGADASEQPLVGEETLHVARAEGGDGGRAGRVVVPQGQGRAVVERAPQVGVDAMDPVAAAAQPELLDHERVK